VISFFQNQLPVSIYSFW